MNPDKEVNKNGLMPIGKGTEDTDAEPTVQKQSSCSSVNTPLSGPLFQIQTSSSGFTGSPYPPQGSTTGSSRNSQNFPIQRAPTQLFCSNTNSSLPRVLEIQVHPRETESVPLQEHPVSTSVTVCPRLPPTSTVSFSSASSVPVSSTRKPAYLKKPHTPTKVNERALFLPQNHRVHSAGAVKPSPFPDPNPLFLPATPPTTPPLLPPKYRPDEYTASPRNFLVSAGTPAPSAPSCPTMNNTAYHHSILSPSKRGVDEARDGSKHRKTITISPEITEGCSDDTRDSQISEDSDETPQPIRRKGKRRSSAGKIEPDELKRRGSLGAAADDGDHSREHLFSPRSRKSVLFNEMTLAQPPEDLDTAPRKPSTESREGSPSLFLEKSRSLSKFGSVPFDDFYLSPNRRTEYGSCKRKEDASAVSGLDNGETERSCGAQHSKSISFAADTSMKQMWKRKHSRSHSKKRRISSTPRRGSRKKSIHPHHHHHERRRGSQRRRRSSVYRHFDSIMSLPEGAYIHGSPFRNDRFADLGPCPTTNHPRIFCYNVFGNPSDPAIVLINGLGSGCTLWPVDFCRLLALNGLFVIRFDNRDSGLTTHWDGFKAFSVYKSALMGLLSKGSPPYTLKDMARDTLDLMDYIGVSTAHILGISMGGMIAQWVAMLAPDRAKSLCLIATHCPGHRVESPSLKLMISNFLDSPKGNDLDSVVEYYVRRRQVLIGDYKADSPGVRELFRKSIIRSPGDKRATRRQFWAVQHEESQSKAVRALSEKGLFPVMIIHGKQDRLIPIANGRAMNEDWIGSELRVFEKMGHNLPEELTETLAELLTKLVERGEMWLDDRRKKV